MKFTKVHMLIIGIVVILLGSTAGFLYRVGFQNEGLLVRVGGSSGQEGFLNARPDFSKYILKSQIPPCNCSPVPEMTNYMLKTECPPVPDLSKYILKSSIPKPQPVIIDNSKCKTDSGECPPCPRPRCPVVKCPPPSKCPTPAPCPRPVCPPTVVKCKSEESTQPTVRPFLAPLNMATFGST